MNILQINTADKGGGAEGSAYNLMRRFRDAGHASWLAVGTKYRDDKDVFEIPREAPNAVLLKRIENIVNRLYYADGGGRGDYDRVRRVIVVVQRRLHDGHDMGRVE